MHLLRSRFRSPDQIIDVRIDQQGPIDGHGYPPQPAQDQTSQQLSHSSDSSIALFTLYLRISEEHDRRQYELFKGEIDLILFFCGLFSATVAALIMPSITGQIILSQDPSSTAPSDDTQRKHYIVLANSLWFYSLVLSICCAAHALILQRSVKPRTWVTSLRYSQPEQARMGVHFAIRIEKANNGVWIFHVVIAYNLFVFYLGFVYFVLVDPNFFMRWLGWLIVYPSICLIQIKIYSWKDPPHCTPFIQQNIQEQASRIDGEVLKRTLDMSRSDDDLEQFFEAIPGFFASKIVENPRRSLDVLGLSRLADALIGFWNCTLSSNRVSESVKVRRLVVCVRVIEATDLSIAVPHILHLLSGDLSEVSRSVEIGHSLRPLRNGKAASLARGIIAIIISGAERNERWSMLVTDELGVSRDVLQNYLTHGDSVLLANLIHITLHFFYALLQPNPDLTREALSILRLISKFDILDTLPELQQDFCALWNDVVRQVESRGAENNPFMDILLDIRGLYIALHDNYDPLRPPASYPLCKDDSHHNSITHVQ